MNISEKTKNKYFSAILKKLLTTGAEMCKIYLESFQINGEENDQTAKGYL